MFEKITIEKLEEEKAILKIQDGNHGEKHPKSKDYVDSGIPFIMANDINNNRLDLDNCKHISKEQANSLRIGFSEKDDILLTHKGTVGNVAIVPDFDPFIMLTPQVTYYRVDNEKLNCRYLGYAFLDPYFQKLLKKISAQSTRPYLGITAQRKLQIHHCPIFKQRKIASILSAYDNLIENNTRRIQILEEMAQRIYKEWFVDFKYPGHENDELVDSELGMIPEGWEISTVNDICEFISRGVTPKYEVGSKRFIINQKANRGPILDMNNLKELRKDLVVPLEKHANLGDLLINCLGEGTIGRVHYFTGENRKYAVDQHMSICRSNNLSISLYLYFHFESPKGQYNIHSLKTGGTNMTMFNISTLRSYQVVLPMEIILSKFYDLIFPLISLKQKLIEENQNLRQTRDLLLPKLISGKVDVSDLDIDTSILDD